MIVMTMGGRLVPAAQQLITEVQQLEPSAVCKFVGAPDGLGFLRTIEFTAKTAKWLGPVMEVIETADPRVRSVDYERKRLRVTFVSDTRADHRDPFPLRAVHDVLTERSGT